MIKSKCLFRTGGWPPVTECCLIQNICFLEPEDVKQGVNKTQNTLAEENIKHSLTLKECQKPTTDTNSHLLVFVLSLLSRWSMRSPATISPP